MLDDLIIIKIILSYFKYQDIFVAIWLFILTIMTLFMIVIGGLTRLTESGLSMVNWQRTKEAKNTLELLIDYGFNELNLHRLWVEIFDTIPENIKLFERMKFVKEGTLKEKIWRNSQWHDSFIYSKVNQTPKHTKKK